MSNRRLITGGSLPSTAFGVAIANNVGTIETSEAGIKDYISRELKIDVHTAQQASLIEAAVTPKDWIGKRKTAMDTVKDNVAEVYKKQLDLAYNTYKYSMEDATNYATRHAQASLDLELDELERRQPGATTIYQSAAVQKDAYNKQFQLVSGDGELSTDEYRALKDRLRAAKSKRKALK
jgi:hypothetical protein